MPRSARIIPDEGYLHVITRGNNHRKLFLNSRDFKTYYYLLSKLKKDENIRIYHYCFMPNHVHLLVGVSQNSALSRFIKRLNLKYFAHYRRKHTYSGHLWQDRFKSKIIEEESYFIQCGKYIESNPVKAFLVKKPEDYHFSSYRYYGFGTKDNLLDEDPLYAGLNACVERRQLIYRNMIINDLVEKSLICK